MTIRKRLAWSNIAMLVIPILAAALLLLVQHDDEKAFWTLAAILEHLFPRDYFNEKLTGARIDANKVLISASEDGGEPVAVGFRAKKANGKYRYFWLYKVKFGIPATNLTTKGESITFSTPTIEGTVMRRNKLDGQNKHPWKAEVSEDSTGVTASVISGWYSEVYEPTFSNT